MRDCEPNEIYDKIYFGWLNFNDLIVWDRYHNMIGNTRSIMDYLYTKD